MGRPIRPTAGDGTVSILRQYGKEMNQDVVSILISIGIPAAWDSMGRVIVYQMVVTVGEAYDALDYSYKLVRPLVRTGRLILEEGNLVGRQLTLEKLRCARM
jgi:hypothetical protein